MITLTPEELAEQRAYLETLTPEQRSAFNDYVQANMDGDRVRGRAAMCCEQDWEYVASLTGSTYYAEMAKASALDEMRFNKQLDEAYAAEDAALARLNELAPEGQRFNEETGRYEEKYVYPVILTQPIGGTGLGLVEFSDDKGDSITVRISEDTWCPGVWAGLEGAKLCTFWKNSPLTIQSVNLESRELVLKPSARSERFIYLAGESLLFWTDPGIVVAPTKPMTATAMNILYNNAIAAQEAYDAKLNHAQHVAQHAMLYGDPNVNPGWLDLDEILGPEPKTPVLYPPESQPAPAATCECGAFKSSNAPRGSMHSTWCPWREP